MSVEHIDLEFAFQYVPDLIRGVESTPIIHFYLSSGVGHQHVQVDPSRTGQTKLQIKNIHKKDGPFIEDDASLNIAVFVDSLNDSDELSSNEAGNNWIFLKEMLHNEDRLLTITRDLVVWNALPNAINKGLSVTKGTITLKIKKVVHPIASKNIDSLFVAPSQYVANKKNLKFIETNLKNYIDRGNLIFQQKKASYEAVQYLHYAMNIWQFGRVHVIGSAYSFPRAQPSDEQVWINLSRAALRRHYINVDLDRAIQLFMNPATTDEEVMTVVSLMHCIYANYATYISDGVLAKKVDHVKSLRSHKEAVKFVQQHLKLSKKFKQTVSSQQSTGQTDYVSMEAFSINMRARGNPETKAATSGDCEDVACEIGLESMELKNRTAWSDDVLKKMHKVRQYHMFLLGLMGVRGAQLSDAERRQANADYVNLGGHMAGFYISNRRFLEMHEKFNKADDPYVGLPLGPTNKTASRPLVLEGTGLNHPLGTDSSQETEDFRKAMLYLETGSDKRALHRVKVMSPLNRQAVNRFYRVLVSFCSPDLADNYASVEHIMLRRNTDGSITHGCNFNEFMSESPYLMTYAMPEFTEDEILVNKQLLKHRFPVIPIQAATETEHSMKQKASLEKIKAVCNRMNRKPNYREPTSVRDFFVRSELVTPEFEEAWTHLIQHKNKIYNFEYFEEPIATNARGFHVRLFMNKV